MPDPTRTDRRQIVTFGGGGFSMESGNPLLDDYVLGLCGSPRPKVCFLPTASGDADHYVVRFYRAFDAGRCEPSHLSLFRREQGSADLAAHLLAQDLIYVGGGSVISMLGAWRAHGVDRILAEAWRRGVVLCGLSAGSLCWYSEAVTSFHGEPQSVRGMALLPWSNCVHYGNEGGRREAYHRALESGMCPGYAISDGAALHFAGTQLAHAVASRRDATAYSVGWHRGDVRESPLVVTYLGSDGEAVAEPNPAELRSASAVAGRAAGELCDVNPGGFSAPGAGIA